MRQFNVCESVSENVLIFAVAFYKRAQILTADINSCMGGNYFSDMHALTMFADYRVPQVNISLNKTLPFVAGSRLPGRAQIQRQPHSSAQSTRERCL